MYLSVNASLVSNYKKPRLQLNTVEPGKITSLLVKLFTIELKFGLSTDFRFFYGKA